MTYNEIIQRLVKADVARWGEKERAASERMNRENYPTLGLALNRLAHLDIDNIDIEMAAEAKRLMTSREWNSLRAVEFDDLV